MEYEKLTIQIRELQTELHFETQKRKSVEHKVKKLVQWLREDHRIYVEDMFDLDLDVNHSESIKLLGIEKANKNRRVSSVINTRNPIDDSKKSHQLFENVYQPGNKNKQDLGDARCPRSLVSPETAYSRHSNSFLNQSRLSHNVVDQVKHNEQVEDFITLRKDLRKETELVTKLRKLMMDTSHPKTYEYKSWPLIKHVWRWVKQLVKHKLDSSGSPYI